MSRFLFKVEDAFEIKGRGLILAPEISGEIKLPKTSKVSLISPDGKTLETEAAFEIPFLHFTSVESRQKYQPAFVCILKDLTKESIQIGTEVWLK